MQMGPLKGGTDYRHWEGSAKSCYLILVNLTMPRVTEVDTFDFNNVIEINDKGPFILHTLLASPGKTRRLGPIKPGLSLQYLKGTWRLMPNVSNVVSCNFRTVEVSYWSLQAYNYNCCREYLILAPDGWAETKTYPLPPGTEGPSSDLSQIGTNAGRTNYARRVGSWYCVKVSKTWLICMYVSLSL